MMRSLAAAALIVLGASASAADEKKVPYWASIASGQAMMRTGPAKTYPGIWLYQRRDLPVKVVQRHDSWRKVVDPDGTQGWMLVTLLSDRRTALVRAGPADIRVKPDGGAAVRYRAEAGVVGRIDKCDGRWCHIAIGKREGWIEQSALIGTDAGERIED